MENTGNAGPARRGRQPKLISEMENAMKTEDSSVPRPDMRSEMREDSPAERAKRRAAEIRGHIGDMDEGTDKYYIPRDIVPDGWTYEWKRRLVLGQEDPSYQVELARKGWTPVPIDRHPEMMPRNWGGGIIERDGMVLMERPAEITEEARSIEKRRARDQVRAKEAQLAGTPDGTMTRDHDQARPKIKKSFAPLDVPED